MTPENIIEICVAIDIAILGIAYPIIIDKISNIGDKYSSNSIAELFGYEFPQRTVTVSFFWKRFQHSIFTWTLLVTISFFVFLIFRLEPLFGWDNCLINNSADLSVFTLTTFLVIFFFIWLTKVLRYNGNTGILLSYFIHKYNTARPGSEKQVTFLKAINDITYYAIEKQDEHLQKTLLEFYSSLFRNIRKNHDRSKPLIYPVDLYFLVNKLNEIAVENES